MPVGSPSLPPSGGVESAPPLLVVEPSGSSKGEGPRAVVTGGASGLGLAIAVELARRGCQVTLVGREAGRLDDARRAVEGAFPAASVETVEVHDLALIEEAKRLGERLARTHPSIALLVNNAGGLFRRREITSEGHERTFALNVLAPFVLTSVLAASLRRAAPSRAVNVVSAAHYYHRLDLDDLELAQRYRGYPAYGRSKLALLLLTREFARRYASQGVSFFGVHPGLVRTHFGQNNRGPYGVAFRWLLGLFGTSVERGAVTPVFAALDRSLDGASGAYLTRRTVRPGSRESNDLAVASTLFDRCSAITGIDPTSAAV